MSDPLFLSLAKSIRDIALVAGEEILSVYESDFSVRNKKDLSPVTAADEAAERVIIEGLSKLEPSFHVLAEESFSRGAIPNVGNEPFWAVDPLDGTKEFISKNGEFTVNIGLIKNHIPVLGVVYAPAINQLYLSSGQWQVTMEVDGLPPEIISSKKMNPNQLIVVASRSHRDEDTDSFLSTLNIADLTSAGSSLKFCVIASGKADVYPRFGPTMEWDTAAAHAVVKYAGGEILKMGSNFEISYNKENLLNPEFLVN